MLTEHTELVSALLDAHDDGEAIDPASVPDGLTVEAGYEIQRAVVERLTGTWGPPAGYKLGFTNGAVQSEFGVSEPIYGRVLGETMRTDGRFEHAPLIEPLAEPEIAFVLDRPLSPPLNRLDALAATRFVVPVVEIVDSRIEGWQFGAPGAVADNAVAARLLVGDPTPVAGTDLSLEGVELRVDGRRRASGTGGAVLGHPAEGLVWLAETLDEQGEALDAGDIVTTGTLTDPIPVDAGETVLARFGSLGTVTAHAE